MEVDLEECLLERVEGLLLNGGLELTFPDGDAVPAKGGETLDGFFVAGLVTVDFAGPEINVGFGNSIGRAAFVSVPETAVDKDASGVFTENNIRMSRKTGVVKTETESMGKEKATDDKLRLGVLGVYRRHVFVSLFGGEFVHGVLVVSS